MNIDPDVRAVLLKVRDEILTDESKWTKSAMARRSDGKFIKWDEEVQEAVNSPSAVCWCLDGACFRAGDIPFPREVFSRLVGRAFLWSWHDEEERTFADIRDLLDRAIGAAS